MRDDTSGFTMVEILIVITILGLLSMASFSAINLMTQYKKARDSKRKNDLRVIKAKLEDYYNDNESYASPEGCNAPTVSCCFEVSCDSNFLSSYLPSFPCDPQKKKYVYCADRLKSSWYKIYTNLENLKDNNLSLAGCETGCQVTLASQKVCYNYGISSTNVALSSGISCQESQTKEAIVTTTLDN